MYVAHNGPPNGSLYKVSAYILLNLLDIQMLLNSDYFNIVVRQVQFRMRMRELIQRSRIVTLFR
jgi:hypothetical protein